MDVHAWFDNIFIGTNTIKDHNERLLWVYTHLKEEKLFISQKKFDPYTPILDILGCKVDSHGVHAHDDKLVKLRNWQTPMDHMEVLHFLGMIEYLARFLPNIGAYTGPLQNICTNNMPFWWSPLHQKCFEQIKLIACKTPVLKPILWEVRENISETEKIKYKVWVITDTCPVGIGAVLVQGEDWKTSHPVAFMSKKFTPAQHVYFGYELEALGILEALTKWLDELMGGHCFTVVTDHKALIYFKQKQHTTGHHIRWQNFFHGFNCDVLYIEGNKNKVTDALLHYYESSTNEDIHYNGYVTADILLDKNGEDLLMKHAVEEHKLLLLHQISHEVCLTASKVVNVIDDHQQSADALDPPGKGIGRSELMLTELLTLDHPLTDEQTFISTVKSAYSTNTDWCNILQEPSRFPLFVS